MGARPKGKAAMVPAPPVSVMAPDPASVAARVADDIMDRRADALTRVDKVDRMLVRSEQERVAMVIALGAVKEARDSWEKDRVAVSNPWRKIADALSAVFKPTVEALDAALARGKRKVVDWQEAEDRRRDEFAERQREREQEAAAKGAIVRPRPVPPPLETRTVAGGSSATTTYRWKFKVVDPDAVPREFCSPSDVLIRARMQSDAKVLGKPRAIPGVEFEQEGGLSIGAAR